MRNVLFVLLAAFCVSFVGCRSSSRPDPQGPFWLTDVRVDEYNVVSVQVNLPDLYSAKLFRNESFFSFIYPADIDNEGWVRLGQFDPGEYDLMLELVLEGPVPQSSRFVNRDGAQESLTVVVNELQSSLFFDVVRDGDRFVANVQVPKGYVGSIGVPATIDRWDTIRFHESTTQINGVPVDESIYGDRIPGEDLLSFDVLGTGEHEVIFYLQWEGNFDDPLRVMPFGFDWVERRTIKILPPEPVPDPLPTAIVGYFNGSEVVLHVVLEGEATLSRQLSDLSITLNGSATVMDPVCDVSLNAQGKIVSRAYDLLTTSGEALQYVVLVSPQTIPVGGTLPEGNSIYRLQRELNDLAVGGSSHVDVKTDFVSDDFDSYWTALGAPVNYLNNSASIVVERAGFKFINEFGLFDAANPENRILVFDGDDGRGDTIEIGILENGEVYLDGEFVGQLSSNRFGFYLDSSAEEAGGLFFSDSNLNSDGNDHLVAYQGDGSTVVDLDNNGYHSGPQEVWGLDMFVLGFEDLIDTCGGETEVAQDIVEPCFESDWDYEDMVVFIRYLKPSPCVEGGLKIVSSKLSY